MRSSQRAISFLLTAIVLVAASAVRGQGSTEAPLPWSGDTIDVDLRTVPFYAVDADGNPVEDLTAEEVRLTVDGQPVRIDVFGRPAAEPAARTGPLVAANAAPSADPDRHVFLLLDTLFTTPGGLLRAKTAGLEFSRRLDPGDRIHLLVNRRSGGFLEVLGPVPGDATGLAALDKAIRAELPDVGSVSTNLDGYIQMPTGARHGSDNIKVAKWMIGDMGRAEYRAAAEDLADGLTVLAARLQALRGPKLLVMLSGGVNSTLYFNGWERLGTGSSSGSMYQSGFRPQTPLRPRFEAPLEALKAAGVQTAFVEVDTRETGGHDTMAHFGEATGGLFLEAANAKDAAARLSRRTSALYELGWYRTQEGAPDGGRIELSSTRPGVELWAPQLAGNRTVSRKIGPDERRFVIVDLVHRGIEPRVAAAKGEPLRDLAGQLGRRVTGETGAQALVFVPSWPESLKERGAELYDVLLRLDRASGKTKIVRLERSLASGAELPRGLSPRTEGAGPFVWGIVAIDRTSGATWLRRLMLESPASDARSVAGESR